MLFYKIYNNSQQQQQNYSIVYQEQCILSDPTQPLCKSCINSYNNNI